MLYISHEFDPCEHIYTCLSSSPTGTSGVLSELYFSNNNDIMRLTNGSSTVVIPGLKLVDTIECNICDRMIYWVDQNPPVAIRRALPGNASFVETVSPYVFGGGVYQCGGVTVVSSIDIILALHIIMSAHTCTLTDTG